MLEGTHHRSRVIRLDRRCLCGPQPNTCALVFIIKLAHSHLSCVSAVFLQRQAGAAVVVTVEGGVD